MNKLKILKTLDLIEDILKMLSNTYKPIMAYLILYYATQIEILRKPILLLFIGICATAYIWDSLISFKELKQKVLGNYQGNVTIHLKEYK